MFDAKDKKFAFESPDSIDPQMLEVFDYQYAGQDITIVTDTEEFTSVCPFSGLPDFGTLKITYVPDQKVIELRSLKYYLLTYRNVGIFYEHLVNRMLEDLAGACAPKSMEIVIEMTTRGGLRTTVSARHPR